MPLSVSDLVTAAKATVTEISAEEGRALLRDPKTVFIDVREPNELRAQGKIVSAVHAPRGLLEFNIDRMSPAHNPVFAQDKKFVFYCGTGGRSILAGKTAQDMGLAEVFSLAGGFGSWLQAGGPTEPVA